MAMGLFTRNTEAGFTLQGMLFIVMLLSLSAAATGIVWEISARREAEQEAIFVAHAWQDAIKSYYQSQGLHEYPATVEDLLEDRRGPRLIRHLRRPYSNPLDREGKWLFITTSLGRIVGISCGLSTQKPITKSGFTLRDRKLESAKTYKEWIWRAD